MKVSKMLVFSAAAFCTVVLTAQNSQAVSGRCDKCHTMHNSQDGAAVTADSTAQGYLLNKSGGCLGCHRGTGTDVSFENTGGTNAPLVDSAQDPATGYANQGGGLGSTLAGGSFYWVTNGADDKGHNVDDLDSHAGGIWPDPDSIQSNTAPGGGGTGAITWGSGATQEKLTCQSGDAGSYYTGCHTKGGHHTNVNPVTGATGGADAVFDGTGTDPGHSYRFLLGIAGYEDGNYEMTYAANDHNEYAGDTAYASALTTTMTALCKRCHGAFHGQNPLSASNGGVGSGSSPWIRHPTDIAMPTTGEYASYDTYNPGVPVAFAVSDLTDPVGDNISDIDTTGTTGIVSCVSCHRAHGSPYADILRWSYATMDAHNDPGLSGWQAGCFQCHTTKDDAL